MTEPTFLLELGGIVVGLALLARIAARWEFPAVPLFLLAGLAFGRGGIVPVLTAGEFVELGAEIGVILLLFMLGLEYSAAGAHRRRSVASPARTRRPAPELPAGFAAGSLLGGAPCRGLPRGHHLHLVVGHRRPTARRPAVARQPGDPGRDLDPRDRGPRDGRVTLPLIAVLVSGVRACSRACSRSPLALARGRPRLLRRTTLGSRRQRRRCSAGPTRRSCSRCSASPSSWPGSRSWSGISAAPSEPSSWG